MGGFDVVWVAKKPFLMWFGWQKTLLFAIFDVVWVAKMIFLLYQR